MNGHFKYLSLLRYLNIKETLNHLRSVRRDHYQEDNENSISAFIEVRYQCRERLGVVH